MEKKLFLFDYDHTLVTPEKTASEILKETICLTIPDGIAPIPDDHYSKFFRDSRRRTEKELARFIATEYYGITPDAFDNFFMTFVKVRADLISKTGIAYGEIYDDALCLLRKLQSRSEVITMLVTGNPKEVMNLRINPQLRKFFVDKQGILKGAFGDEASSRKYLIELAIKKAEESEGFNPENDVFFGFKRNVFYIGDTEGELLAGLEAKVRTVYCHSHSYSGYGLPASKIRLLSWVSDENGHQE